MKTIIIGIIAILFTSCYPSIDSIHNHKEEVLVRREYISPNQSIITTRIYTKDGYKFTRFRVYDSELIGLTINDTIK